MTLAALHRARSLGFGAAVLGASAMGARIYRRLGFRDLCRIAIHEWRGGGPP